MPVDYFLYFPELQFMLNNDLAIGNDGLNIYASFTAEGMRQRMLPNPFLWIRLGDITKDLEIIFEFTGVLFIIPAGIIPH